VAVLAPARSSIFIITLLPNYPALPLLAHSLTTTYTFKDDAHPAHSIWVASASVWGKKLITSSSMQPDSLTCRDEIKMNENFCLSRNPRHTRAATKKPLTELLICLKKQSVIQEILLMANYAYKQKEDIALCHCYATVMDEKYR
jgi:hypothetical protein